MKGHARRLEGRSIGSAFVRDRDGESNRHLTPSPSKRIADHRRNASERDTFKSCGIVVKNRDFVAV
jgi:hypothetical protein